ncbi:tail fiber protein [Aeromonas phage Gekk3-15]
MTDRIPSKFAVNGDVQAIDLTDPSGKVNWDQGYGPDYERKIGADVNAKAVERKKQNWLFGVLTENAKQWQDQAFPDWRGTSVGTVGIAYPKNATVRYTVNGNNYRAIQAVPANTLPTNATYWELVLTNAQITAFSPMPAGGGNPDVEVLNSASGVVLANFPSGTWEVTVNAVSITDLPEAVPGMLEVKAWSIDPSVPPRTAAIQRYQAVSGRTWHRSSDGNTWTTWERIQMRSEVVNRGYFDSSGMANNDLNNATQTGFYAVAPNCLNGPADFPAVANGSLQVIRRAQGDIVTQMLIADNSGKGIPPIWTRTWIAPNTWRPWRAGAAVEVVPAPLSQAANSAGIDFDSGANGTKHLDATGFANSTGIKPTGNLGGTLTCMQVAAGVSVQTFQDLSGDFSYRSNSGSGWSSWVSPSQFAGNFLGVKVAPVPATLQPSDCGKMVMIPSGQGRLTLPPISGLKEGSAIHLKSSVVNNYIEVATPDGSQMVFRAGAASTTFNLDIGEDATITKVGTTWVVTGTTVLRRLLYMESSTGLSGFQKWPNGMILQWGSASIPLGQTATVVTFPIAFPNALVAATVVDKGRGQYPAGVSVASRVTMQLETPITEPTGLNFYWTALGY